MITERIYFWNGIQTVKVFLNSNKIETNFENYFKLLYKKIRRKKIKFSESKTISELEIEGKMPLWIHLWWILRSPMI